MECLHCRKGCATSLGDKCVQYTGDDIPELGIKRGMFLDEVIFKMGMGLVSLLTQKVSLNSLADGGDSDAVVSIAEGLQMAINKFSNLSTDDIAYKSNIPAVSSGAAAPLMGKTLQYNTLKSPQGTSFGWDLTQDLQGLPDGYRVMRTRAVGSGSELNGKTLLFDSNKANDIYNIGNDRFPLSVNMEVDIRTPEGDVKLQKTAFISAPESNSYVQNYEVIDNTVKVANATNLTNLAEMLQKQSDLHTSKLSNIENVKVSGISGTGLQTVLGQIKNATDTQAEEIKTLKEIEYKEEGNLKRGSVQQFIDSNQKALEDVSAKVSIVEDDVNSVKGQI